MSVVQVTIDRSSSETLVGIKTFDRANGGTLVAPSGTTFPAAPVAGEWFWKTDVAKLYRRNDSNTDWDTVTAAVTVHASTHEHDGTDVIDHQQLYGAGTHTHSQIDTHLDAAAPHSGHENTANKNQPSGYAGLDASSKLTGSQQVYGTGTNTACQGNDSRLSDSRPPTAHATSHKSGGSDTIKLDELATPTDVTTLNVSTSAHGLTPKLPNDAAKFLDGTGAWVNPASVLKKWRQSVFAEISADTTTTSTTWTDLLSLSITTEAGYIQCLASSCFTMSNASGREMALRLVIDDVAQRACASMSDSTTYGEIFSIVFKKAVAAGAHTVKLQWKTSSATYTMRCRPVTAPDVEHCSLLVEEVG